VILDLLRAEDLEAALTLSTAEGWNQTAADWRRILRLGPAGCFAARDGGRLVGTVTTTTYGTELAWIGMMIVHPELRGRGIGATLMGKALDHLQSSGIATVKLDATPAGRPLYESLGFVAETAMERWQGVPAGVAPPQGRPDDTPGAPFVLDRSAYGVDRTSLLELLLADTAVDPMVNASGSAPPTGFALARRGRLATYIGPIVATNPSTARQLLVEALTTFAGEEVCLDLHQGSHLSGETLATHGLSKRRVLTRMSHGPRTDSAISRAICASAGPEFG
jgi:GNAT superfamily N-acetyltransferase